LIVVAIAVTGENGGDGNGGSGSTTTPPPPEGEEHGHDNSIYVVNLRSRRVRQITDGQIAQHPAWAPDERIAFSAADCDDECWSQLFHIDAQAENQVLIARRGTTHLFHPSWSPDGRHIATVDLGQGILSVATKDGKIRQLTKGQSDEAPEWSPRGNWIAYDKRVRDTNYDIFAVHAFTRKVRRLTRDVSQQTNPAWSPDGSRLAFAEQQADGKWAIVTMRLDGSDRKRVTGGGISAQEPSWSPDGNSIAFVKQGLDRALIAVVPVKGGEPETITTTKFVASTPAWSPDGKSIAFSGQPVEQ
jgi:Tol biopolymer transport system component